MTGKTERIPKSHMEALRTITERFRGKDVTWVLVGSTALAIHGVDVPVNDIDILTTIESADKIQEILKDYMLEPMHYRENSQFKSYYGLFEINGIKIEIIADLEKIYNGKWVKKENFGMRTVKMYDGIIVSLLDLREEYDAYKNMEKTEKADKIYEVLERRRHPTSRAS